MGISVIWPETGKSYSAVVTKLSDTSLHVCYDSDGTKESIPWSDIKSRDVQLKRESSRRRATTIRQKYRESLQTTTTSSRSNKIKKRSRPFSSSSTQQKKK